MKMVTTFLVAIAALPLAFAVEAAPIYLNVNATGGDGDEKVYDGSTWSKAFKDFTSAITALNSSGDSPAELRIALGCYIVSGANTMSHTNFVVKGGYRAQADNDDTRDRMEYQTILYWKDVPLTQKWNHIVPKCSAFAAPTVAETAYQVIDNGKLTEPPAFDGDYDTYCGSKGGTGGAIAITVSSGAKGTIDGLNFTGFRNGGPACISIVGGPTTVSRCRFIGNNPSTGCIYDSSSSATLISDCDFSFNYSGNCDNGIFFRGGNTTVSGCRFVGNYKTGGWGSCVLHVEGSATGHVITNCVFTRNGGTGSNENNATQPGLICGSNGPTFEFYDCEITNNCSYSTEGYGVPLMAVKGLVMQRCHVAGNQHYAKALDGRAYSLVGSGYGNSYSMRIVGSVFEQNLVNVAELKFTAGEYFAGIVGGPGYGIGTVLKDCTFKDNTATGLESAGVRAVTCRGAFTMGYFRFDNNQNYNVAANSYLAVANCLFTGTAANKVFDIMQVGLGHNYNLNVLNSIFQREGDAPYNPFYVVKPWLVKVYSSTFKNMTAADYPSDIAVADQIATDEIPFGRKSGSFLYEPLAKTPLIRTGADVSLNNAAGTSWAFRQYGSETWQVLAPGTSLDPGVGTTMAGDALDVIRTEGAMTRGPIQTLGGNADSGCTLTIRRSPLAGGTVSTPSTQAVATNGAITAVTATPAGELNFDGWYTPDDSLYSTDNPLTINALASNLVLVAIFAGDVDLTFNLGSGGTFEGGYSTYVTNIAAGAEFPALPKFVPAPGKTLAGWTAKLPATVPGADTTYTARYTEGGIHVVPLGDPALATGTGDGLTWGNAIANLQTAIDQAAEFGGEVWVKTGVYTNSSFYMPRSGVTVVGGFAGNETSAGQANPEAYPSVLTGDLAGNNYWKSDDKVSRGSIWSGMTFNAPNPQGTNVFWGATGDISDGSFGFYDTSSTLSDFKLVGLTFTGYRYSAAFLGGIGTVLTNCTIVACNCYNNVDQSQAAVWLRGTSGAIVGCTFIGNFRPLSASVPLVKDCRFTENWCSGRDGGGLDIRGAMTVTNCVFYRNSTTHFNAAAAVNMNNTAGYNYIYDCTFEENRIGSTGPATVWAKNGYVTRCKFLRNRVLAAAGAHNTACFKMSGGDFLVRDSYFDGNSIAGASSGTDEYMWSVIGYSTDGRLAFFNSTFTGSKVTATATAGSLDIGSFGAHSADDNQTLALANCTVVGSEFDVTEDGGVCRVGECAYTTRATAASTFGVVDCIFWGPADDYVAIYQQTNLVPLIANSYLKNYSAEGLTLGSYDYIENLYTSGNLGLISKPRDPSDGIYLPQIGVTGASAFKKAGVPVYVSGTKCYFYDANKKTYRNIGGKGSTKSSVGDIQPDAWGAARVADKISLGPINYLPQSFSIIVR